MKCLSVSVKAIRSRLLGLWSHFCESTPQGNLLEQINALGDFFGDGLVGGGVLVLDVAPPAQRQMLRPLLVAPEQGQDEKDDLSSCHERVNLSLTYSASSSPSSTCTSSSPTWSFILQVHGVRIASHKKFFRVVDLRRCFFGLDLCKG